MRDRAALARTLLIGALVTFGSGASSEEPKNQPEVARSSLPRVTIEMERVRLANGMLVVLVEDHTAPVITVGLAYDVGSANEHQGRTGFAHLFEHLMFQGSQNVEPGQHSILIDRYGGVANATTGTDWTFYFETIPANQLDLALFLESDRLRSLNISQENLDKEKEVVKEERRMRVDNQPYRRSAFLLEDLIYDSFAYSHDGVGSMADLDAASLGDVRAFFDQYYRASSLVLVLIGDFAAKPALAKVEKYFGALQTRPKPPQADRTEPPQQQDRRQIVEDPLAPLPQLIVAFKTVPGSHADYFALDVLLAVLQGGDSSRLHEELVKHKELVTDLSGSNEERRGAGKLSVTAVVRADNTINDVESSIYREVERLQKEPIADWELEKAKNSIAASYLDRLHRSVMRSIFIGAYAVDFDDPQRINSYLDRIAAVTKEDVLRVAKVHLRVGNRTVLITMPKKAQGASR